MARKVARTTRKRRKPNSTLIADLTGVVLLFLGPITFISLVTKDKGELGRLIYKILTDLMGIGAYAAPLLFIFLGVLLLVGPIKAASKSTGAGVLMLFFVVLAWRQMDIEAADSKVLGGGLLGISIAHSIDRLFGAASAVVLVLLAIVSVIIAVNLPISAIIRFIAEYVNAGAEGVRDRLSEPAGAKALPKKNGQVKSAKDFAKTVDEEPKPKKSLLGFLKGDDKEDEIDEPIITSPNQPERDVLIKYAHPPKKDKPAPGPILDFDNDDDDDDRPYRIPPLDLLNDPQPPPARVESELRGNVEIIERTLDEFNVQATVVEIAHGPTVTRYEIQLGKGVKVSKITSLADNLAMQLSAIDVRVEAPIPGKAAIGVEVPNKLKAVVGLREVIEHDGFMKSDSLLTFALGKDVSGTPLWTDLTKMPHLLIAGATNSGKSVALNTLISSMLFRCTPDQLKLILIDPKRVELSLFDAIPHLACPVIKDVRMAAGALRQAVKEMEHRYELLARAGARNILTYNDKVPEGDKLPYIVLVVDELADLMMQARAEVEQLIARLAQLARATGIHLVIATQRPSVDVVTGLIKANISSRMAFAVTSQVDSRTILDTGGAERLIGRGDMLFMPIDASKPTRIQGCYLSDKETEDLVKYLKSQGKPVYTIDPSVSIGDGGGAGGNNDEGTADELYEMAVRLVVAKGSASTSSLQRRFKIGYNRAARLLDTMEQQGIVGALDGAKPREVLVSEADMDRMFAGQYEESAVYEVEEEENEADY